MNESEKQEVIVDGIPFEMTVGAGRVTVTHASYGSASRSPIQNNDIAIDLARELIEKAKTCG